MSKKSGTLNRREFLKLAGAASAAGILAACAPKATPTPAPVPKRVPQ